MRALVVLAGLLVLLPLDATAQAQGVATAPHSPRGIAVVDANGKQVGTVVEARLRDVTIALSVNGRRVLLDVVSSVSTEYYPGALFPPFRGAALLAFESRDCSGPPFLFEYPDRLLDAGHVGPPGLTLHLPAVPGAVPATIASGSYLGPLGCQAPEFRLAGSFVPAVAVVDLLTLFTPPFRVVVVE